MQIKGNLADIHQRAIYPAEITVENGRISEIRKSDEDYDRYILPGMVDAHVHIESSMVTPRAFSDAAVRHGTVGAVSDPHEIANVLGKEGIDFMLENASGAPLKILFGAPSCVPATNFESSGAEITADAIAELLDRKGIGFLSEMMNYPGVIHKDPDVCRKLKVAQEKGVPVDGHAPGLVGEDVVKYAGAGISTDHECFTRQEALEKIKAGMKILIREGSAAKNYPALISLLNLYPEEIMFCTDDLHPDDLVEGHINRIVARAIGEGYDVFDVLKAASMNAVKHYNLDIGLLREGDPADFIITDSLEPLHVVSTFINGKEVYKDGDPKPRKRSISVKPNIFEAEKIAASDLQIRGTGNKIRVIQAQDGELITREQILTPAMNGKFLSSDTERDILKLVVVNRYRKSKPAVAFINGFGLKNGALVSSIAHDSHNIISVGVSDQEITEAINWVIGKRGGIAVYDGKKVSGLPLEIGGIMYDGSVEAAAAKYLEVSSITRTLGTDLTAPFMTLAFMALLVIPEIKLSDKGLFDGTRFAFTSLFVDEK